MPKMVLLQYSEVSSAIMCERFIRSGYRPPFQPWLYYIKSCMTLHNETMNIWSHFIGLLVLLERCYYYWDMYRDFDDYRVYPLLIFGLCTMITHALSVTAHLFHSKSIDVHYRVLLVDYIGVAIYAFGTCIIGIYSCSDKDMYKLLSPYYMPFVTLFTWLNHTCLCLSKLSEIGSKQINVPRRRMVQVGVNVVHVIIIMLPVLPRYSRCTLGELSSLNHITVCLLTIFTAAVFFISEFPERLLPGTFDIYGTGHQIFHVVSTTTHVLQMRAVHIDLQNGIATEHSQPNPVNILMYLGVALALMIGSSLLYMNKYLNTANLKKTENHAKIKNQ